MLHLIAYVAVDFRFTADRVFHLPFPNFDGNSRRQLHSAHVYEQLKIRNANRRQVLRKLPVKRNVFFLHHFVSKWLNNGGGRKTGTLRMHDIAAVAFRESLRHLTTAGVTNAKKENSFHSMLLILADLMT